MTEQIVSKVSDRRAGNFRTGPWSPPEVEYLFAHYEHQPVAVTAAYLGRPSESVRRAAASRGLKRIHNIPKSTGRPRGKKSKPKSAAVELPDVDRSIVTLPPTGPGYGPRTIHRSGVAA